MIATSEGECRVTMTCHTRIQDGSIVRVTVLPPNHQQYTLSLERVIGVILGILLATKFTLIDNNVIVDKTRR